MKKKLSHLVLITLLAIFNTQVIAEETQTETPNVVGGLASTPKSKKRLADKRKVVAKIKTIDINTASAKELKKLPYIDDAAAARIIAGRPYGSKLWLVTNGIIGEGPYISIKDRIVAGQPYKDLNKNAALYQGQKK